MSYLYTEIFDEIIKNDIFAMQTDQSHPITDSPMTDTMFIYAFSILAMLIIIGFITMIITIRRLHKTEKELLKYGKAKVAEKKYGWYRH